MDLLDIEPYTEFDITLKEVYDAYTSNDYPYELEAEMLVTGGERLDPFATLLKEQYPSSNYYPYSFTTGGYFIHIPLSESKYVIKLYNSDKQVIFEREYAYNNELRKAYQEYKTMFEENELWIENVLNGLPPDYKH